MLTLPPEAQYWNTRLTITVPRSTLAPVAPPLRAFFVARIIRPRYTRGMTKHPSDDLLRKILKESKTLACVGLSMNPIRPSYFVARYLSLKGFRVIPINPGHAGKMLFGEEIRADLAAIPDTIQIDVVDIFRRSEHVLPIVEDALAQFPNLKTIWMQVGVENAEAADLAQARGVQVIQNRCPKIENQRLFGELRMGGFNTGIISSKL
jgi:uncharacterized protein